MKKGAFQIKIYGMESSKVAILLDGLQTQFTVFGEGLATLTADMKEIKLDIKNIRDCLIKIYDILIEKGVCHAVSKMCIKRVCA